MSVEIATIFLPFFLTALEQYEMYFFKAETKIQELVTNINVRKYNIPSLNNSYR